MCVAIHKLFLPKEEAASPQGIISLEMGLAVLLMSGLVVLEIGHLVTFFLLGKNARERHVPGAGHKPGYHPAFPIKEAAFILICLVISGVLWIGFVAVGAIERPEHAKGNASPQIEKS